MGAAAGPATTIRAITERCATEMVAGYHDIQTAVNLTLRNAEAVIGELPGETDEEKIDNAPPALKSLLKSVGLLKSRLNMASILANPESAGFGNPRPTPVYRVVHRMVRLFEEQAQRYRVRLRMTGTSFNTPSLYDSFETIPLVLIDNAIKYSYHNTEIVVSVDDLPGVAWRCRIEVNSVGDIVPEHLRRRVFERGFRSPGAKETVATGSGLGLFVASIVAGVHQTEIYYQADAFRTNARSASNTFGLVVGSVSASRQP